MAIFLVQPPIPIPTFFWEINYSYLIRLIKYLLSLHDTVNESECMTHPNIIFIGYLIADTSIITRSLN